MDKHGLARFEAPADLEAEVREGLLQQGGGVAQLLVVAVVRERGRLFEEGQRRQLVVGEAVGLGLGDRVRAAAQVNFGVGCRRGLVMVMDWDGAIRGRRRRSNSPRRTMNRALAPLIWEKSSARPDASSSLDSAATALMRSAPLTSLGIIG